MTRLFELLAAAALLFATARPTAAASCVPSSTDLCLLGDRFTARISWNDGSGEKQAFVAEPQTDTDDSTAGIFFYYVEDASNWEILVKMIDGCRTNDHFWVLVAGSTGFGWTLEVTDEATGVVRTFTHPLDGQGSGLEDFEAFSTCATVTPTPTPRPTATRTPGPTPSGPPTPTPSPTTAPTPTPWIEPTPDEYSAVVRYRNRTMIRCGLHEEGFWNSLLAFQHQSWLSVDGDYSPYENVYVHTIGPFTVTTTGGNPVLCPPPVVEYSTTLELVFGRRYTISKMNGVLTIQWDG